VTPLNNMPLPWYFDFESNPVRGGSRLSPCFAGQVDGFARGDATLRLSLVTDSEPECSRGDASSSTEGAQGAYWVQESRQRGA
jgi:hypothetical protein